MCERVSECSNNTPYSYWRRGRCATCNLQSHTVCANKQEGRTVVACVVGARETIVRGRHSRMHIAHTSLYLSIQFEISFVVESSSCTRFHNFHISTLCKWAYAVAVDREEANAYRSRNTEKFVWKSIYCSNFVRRRVFIDSTATLQNYKKYNRALHWTIPVAQE